MRTAAWILIVLSFYITEAFAEKEQLSPSQLIDRGDHEGAITLLDEYVNEFEKQKADNPDDTTINEKIARILIWQGTLQLDLARSKKSIASFERALRSLAYSPENIRLFGTIHDGLGRGYHLDGQHDEAERSLRRALAYRLGLASEQKTKWVPATREHLGLLLLSMGHYEEAGQELQLSLDETAKEDIPSLAQRKASLGRYHHTLRSYSRAKDFFEEALKLAEQAWGREHPNTFMILDQLGLTLLRQGETAQARAILEEASILAKKQAGKTIGSIRYATILNNYGNLLIEEGEVIVAQKAFQSALSSLENILEPKHPALAPVWSNLAYTHFSQGDYLSAMSLYQKARDSYLESVGPLHQRSVEALNNLSLAAFLGKDPKANQLITAANEAHQNIIRELLAFGTEPQRLNYLQRSDPYSLPCSSAKNPELIANTLLQSKGRLLDTLLSEKSTDEAITEPIDWEVIQAKLLPRSALVDFIRYQDYHSGDSKEIRYGAILLLPNCPPEWVPLGTESTLVSWLNAKQQRLAWRSTQLGEPDGSTAPPLKMSAALRRLYDEFWAPVADKLPAETDTLALCPDSTLNFLSFATLLDERNQFFSEKYKLAFYLSSARDLLAPPSSESLQKNPWAIFAVDEFVSPTQKLSPRDQQEEQLFQILNRLNPIAGARQEVGILRKHQSKNTSVFQNENATEKKLRTLTTSPSVLHLVTHGFLLPSYDRQSSRLTDFDESPGRLARSGLVLHAPTVDQPSESNDILYSHEVSNLPLTNTRLVTLSSCDSGLGEDLSGEGILGLRRGFALAGADNLLLALWPVSDATTPEFMNRFYQIATHTNHLSQATWQTQREFLAGIDPTNEAALETTVLNYGPFVLCQREALTAASKTIPEASKFPWPRILGFVILIALGVFFVSKMKKQVAHSSEKSV